VSNSGPLIHLAKADLIEVLTTLYRVDIPVEVKEEVVDRGKEMGFSDALLVEKAIREGLIRVVEVKVEESFASVARRAGLHQAETAVIFHALKNNALVLLDEDAAREFAKALGLRIRGSIGLLLEALKKGLLKPTEALEKLDVLAETMYLSSDVYRVARKEIERSRQKEFAEASLMRRNLVNPYACKFSKKPLHKNSWNMRSST